jgi:hypothetical protein
MKTKGIEQSPNKKFQPTKVDKVTVNEIPSTLQRDAQLTAGEKLTEAGKEIVNEVVVPAAEGIVKSFFRRLLERIRL